jgi:hypothetical protein
LPLSEVRDGLLGCQDGLSDVTEQSRPKPVCRKVGTADFADLIAKSHKVSNANSTATCKSRPTESAFHLRSEMLRQVHSVGDGNDEQLRVPQCWPVEEIVYDILLGRQQLIQFVHQDDAE